MQPSRPRGRYLMGLDGLRALAIIAVVFYHVAPQVLPGGFIGVDVFFVISGLLITTLLIEEQNAHSHIRLRNFWKRRARRLLPALLATICITCSVAYFIGGDVLVGIARQIIGAATFSNNWVEIAAGSNYFDASNPHLFTNFWSLAVEEQFYLVWPFIVTALVSIGSLAKRPKVGVWLCGLLALGSGLAMAFTFKETNVTRVYYGTDTHIFGLMIGAMMAFSARRKTMQSTPVQTTKPRRTVKKLGWAALIGLAVLMFTLGDQTSLTYQGGLQLASVLSAVLVVSVITTRGRLHKLFTAKPLEWIGIRSYGIYLWHWPVLILLRQSLGSSVSGMEIGVLTCSITLCVATLSFRYLETPIRVQGLRNFVLRGIRREVQVLDGAVAQWKIQPHPVMLAACLALILTLVSIFSAPQKTTAQLRIEAGQRAIAQAKVQAAARAAKAQQAPIISTKGDNITVIGDSVTLASAGALEQRFPGIYIDAVVSRSLRQGGFDTVDGLISSGAMRGVVVIALGTNGYYGEGSLERLINQLGSREIVFVTAHAPDDWAPGNNDNLHKTVPAYRNVRIAEWDQAISPHGDELADDIHPNADGANLYADSIAAALAQFPH